MVTSTISISQAAIDRRNRMYGATFGTSIIASATEMAPGVYHISMAAYVTIIRAHNSGRADLIQQVARGVMPPMVSEMARVVRPKPVPKKK